MTLEQRAVWLAAGVRTPFANVDGAFANRDAVALSVPVAQAMASRVKGPIDFAVWGWVVQNLNYVNLAREIWFDAKLDPRVPSFTTIMQCSTSLHMHTFSSGKIRRCCIDRLSPPQFSGHSTAPAFVRYWSNSGQQSIVTLIGP